MSRALNLHSMKAGSKGFMKNWLRSLPHPTYGKAGGARKDVAIRRDELDPLDQLFYDHDWGLDSCHTDEEKREHDLKLHSALESFNRYNEIHWKRRLWARVYVSSIVRSGIFKRL